MAAEKKYICSFCARAFSRSEHKQRHERSHTNEKPFHCVHCTSAFVRRDLLQRHCKTVHNIAISKERRHSTGSAIKSIGMNGVVGNTGVGVGVIGGVGGGANGGGVGSSSSSSSSDIKVGVGMGGGPANGAYACGMNSAVAIGARPHAITNHGLLLSIAHKVGAILKSEAESEIFVVGYTMLAQDDAPIIPEVLQNLSKFLQFHQIDRIPDFKLCLIYSILSIGHMNVGNTAHCIANFQHSWSLLVQKLIPDYNNNNTNPNDQIEILNSLYILSYMHLKYNLNQYKSMDVTCDLNFNYLDDISYIIMSNLSLNSNIINKNMNLFWCIYNLLSLYQINDGPPKFYQLFLLRPILNLSLIDFMNNISQADTSSKFIQEVMISTVSNELNYFKRTNKLLIFKLTRALHNSIILIHKIIPETSNIEIYEIFKKNLIIKSPSKFHDILRSYIFNPVESIHFNLLSVLLKEFNLSSVQSFNFKAFINSNLNNSLQTFSSAMLPFFEIENREINNNLGIVSFPLIFNLRFVNFQSVDILKLDNLNFEDKMNLNYLIIEWYVTLVKLLINLWKNNHLIDNCILQCLLYLINDNSSDFQFNTEFFWCVFRKLNYYFETWLSFIKNQYFLVNFKNNLHKFVLNYIQSSLNLLSSSVYESRSVTRPNDFMLPPIMPHINPPRTSL